MGDPERDEPSLELDLPRLRLRRPRRRPRPPVPVAERVVETVAQPPPPAPTRRARAAFALPSGWPAVVAGGVLVGLVLVGLTWASLQACQAVQGTSSCGTVGYPMLGLVLAVAVLVGGVVLRLARVPDPVSTSLLGVGVAAVVALVFLIDSLDRPAMVVVLPLVCAATFAGAHWLTTAVIDPERG